MADDDLGFASFPDENADLDDVPLLSDHARRWRIVGRVGVRQARRRARFLWPRHAPGVETLLRAGNVLWYAGDFDGARRLYGRAGRAAMRLGDLRLAGMSSSNRAAALGSQGAPKAGLVHAHIALETFERSEISSLVAYGHNSIGALHAQAGQVSEALDAYERAAAGFQAFGDLASEAVVYERIGGIQTVAAEGSPKRLRAACSAYEHALELAQRSGDCSVQASILVGLGNACEALANADPREKATYQARRLIHGIRFDVGIDGSVEPVDEVMDAGGERARALTHYRQAVALCEAAGDVGGRAEALAAIGLLYLMLEDADKAEEHFVAARDGYREVGDRIEFARQLHNLALTAATRYEEERPRRLLHAALDIHIRFRHWRGVVEELIELAALENDDDRRRSARRLLRRAASLSRSRCFGYLQEEITEGLEFLEDLGK